MNTLLTTICLVLVSASVASAGALGTCLPPKTEAEIKPERFWYDPDYTVGQEITLTCKKYYLYDELKGEFVRGLKLVAKCIGSNRYSPPIRDNQYSCKERGAACTLKASRPLIATPSQSSFTRGDSVSFKCEKGYYLRGEDYLVCGKNGVWSDNIPVCLPYCKKPSQPYLIVTDNAKSYRTGGTITLTCEKGYRLQGSYKRYCEGNGKFDPEIEDDICQRTGCSPPRKFPNGKYVPGPGSDNWYEVNERITYSCDVNYYLKGKYQRVCSRKGEFIYGEPECIEVRCDTPMDIDNGQFGPVRDDYPVDDTVEYECDKNYRLSTKSGVRRCLLNDDKKSADFEKHPTCIRIECDKPKSIDDGSFSPSKGPYYVGDTVDYKCRYGFYLDGDEEVECLLNKNELTADFESPPSCKPILCDKPMAPIKGSFTPVQDEYRLDKSVTFTCAKNYYLDGPSTATCIKDTRTKGKFTKIPKCIEVRCKKPMTPSKGKITPSQDDYPVGDDLTYSCSPNYRLVPTDGDRTCTLNPDKKSASFGPGAQCVRIECDKPMDIADGDFKPTQKAYYVGDSVTYTCEPGYYLKGSEESTCELNSDKVSADFTSPPECIRIECKKPMELDNGDIIKGESKKYYIGDEVTYECDETFYLKGDATVTCKQTGTRIAQFDPAPECIPIECDDPMPLDNGDFDPEPKGPYYVGAVVTYVCDRGYKFSSRITSIRCELDKGGLTASFSKLPMCERVYCSNPGYPDNGAIEEDKKRYVVDETITWSCARCYKLSGAETATCQQNGRFDQSLPSCVLRKCSKKAISIPKYSFFGPLKKEYDCDEKITYQCSRNYKLIGDDEAVCLPDGSFSKIKTTCELIKCARPKLNDGVRVKPDKDSYTVGTQITYSCKRGLKPDTTTLEAVCQIDTTFTYPSPNCVPITCGKPPLPSYGYIVDYNSYKEEYAKYEVVDYKCNKYYTLNGVETNECGSTGEWLYRAPRCDPPVCKGNCHLGNTRGRPCQCDHGCLKRRDCCADFKPECYIKSCRDRCGESDKNGCSCKAECTTNPGLFACCPDYHDQCPGTWYLF